MHTRNRTPSQYIGYGLYFYFSGLSLRRAFDRLSSYFIKRNHVSVWNWIQKYKPQRISSKKTKFEGFAVDEALLKIGSELVWPWVAIEPANKEILSVGISRERNMLVAKRFLSGLLEEHGEHPVSADGGTWYPQA